MTFQNALIRSLIEASRYNRQVQAPPAAVLWTDSSLEWKDAIPSLQVELPQLFVLGEYKPDSRQGPAIWLKCVVARALNDIDYPVNAIPIIYLPGVSRHDLRAIEQCLRDLQPLAELQYRGTFWSQTNGKDWTINAFLVSKSGGIGASVAKDLRTQEAVKRALSSGELSQQKVDFLKSKHLDASFFDGLVAPDPVRDILVWMNEPLKTKNEWNGNRWHVFIERCQKDYRFHPEKDGELSAAEKLAQHEGNWNPVWNLYCDSFGRFPNVYDLLSKLSPPPGMLPFDLSGYPSFNSSRETELRDALASLEGKSAAEAVIVINNEENGHGMRRKWIWATMGKSPLACALGHLNKLAALCQLPLRCTSIDELINQYTVELWGADAAAIDAVACVSSKADTSAVHAALKALYSPWLENLALKFQDLVKNDPAALEPFSTLADWNNLDSGVCALFVDGLRFDAGQKLMAMLAASMEVTALHHWAGIPSVTASGKVRVSPVASFCEGSDETMDFEPITKDEKKPADAYNFRKLLKSHGWNYIESSEVGDISGKGWTECGDLDHYGHEHGIKLARALNDQLAVVVERTHEMLEAGWRKVRIVTDHGWLLIPGGLPKASIQKFDVESRSGRCAVLKNTSVAQHMVLPWDWNPMVQVALAPGCASFLAGMEYAHGGLSLQECVVQILDIEPKQASPKHVACTVKSVVWAQLRCRIEIAPGDGIRYTDIRTKANDASTSIVSRKKVDQDGKVSLVVEDDRHEGSAAFIVILDENGALLQKEPTTIGG